MQLVLFGMRGMHVRTRAWRARKTWWLLKISDSYFHKLKPQVTRILHKLTFLTCSLESKIVLPVSAISVLDPDKP